MGASESEIHPFCSVGDWYSSGKHRRHGSMRSYESLRGMSEMIKGVHLQESCVEKQKHDADS